MNDPQFVDVNGTRTRYFVAGDGEPLVLVHGGNFGDGACAEDWELSFPGLAERFRVFALDKLGMGFTDNPRSDDGYSLGAQAEHLRGFLEALELESAHLVGHSRGGYAVTRVALDDPDKVRSLLIVSSSSVINPLNPVYGQWRREAEQLEERDAARYLIEANSYAATHITDRWLDVIVEIKRLEKTQAAASKMQGEFFERFRADVRARVDEVKEQVAAGALRVPTLLVWGTEDPSATMERCIKPAIDLFFSSVADCEMHLFGRAGHFCYREHPEGFNAVVSDFIERAGATGTRPGIDSQVR